MCAPVYLFLQIHSALKVITIYITEGPTSATTFKSLAVILYKLPFLLASYSLSSYLQLQSTYHSSIFMLISTSVYAVQRFTSVLLEKYVTYFVFIKHLYFALPNTDQLVAIFMWPGVHLLYYRSPLLGNKNFSNWSTLSDVASHCNYAKVILDQWQARFKNIFNSMKCVLTVDFSYAWFIAKIIIPRNWRWGWHQRSQLFACANLNPVIPAFCLEIPFCGNKAWAKWLPSFQIYRVAENVFSLKISKFRSYCLILKASSFCCLKINK